MVTRNVCRVSKEQWYRLGGFRNSQLFRKADSRGAWRYYIDYGYSA
jgi:hypothetical protein